MTSRITFCETHSLMFSWNLFSAELVSVSPWGCVRRTRWVSAASWESVYSCTSVRLCACVVNPRWCWEPPVWLDQCPSGSVWSAPCHHISGLNEVVWVCGHVCVFMCPLSFSSAWFSVKNVFVNPDLCNSKHLNISVSFLKALKENSLHLCCAHYSSFCLYYCRTHKRTEMQIIHLSAKAFPPRELFKFWTVC